MGVCDSSPLITMAACSGNETDNPLRQYKEFTEPWGGICFYPLHQFVIQIKSDSLCSSKFSQMISFPQPLARQEPSAQAISPRRAEAQGVLWLKCAGPILIKQMGNDYLLSGTNQRLYMCSETVK